MSAILPGLGQFYNKKLWKVPIIYSGLIGFGYYYKINNEEYNKYRSSVIAYYDNDPSTIPAITNYSGDQLQSLKLSYKKSRDLAAIGLVIVYLFNIIDANVDGHLKSFDVSDDLSLKIDPWQNIYQDSYNNYNTNHFLCFPRDILFSCPCTVCRENSWQHWRYLAQWSEILVDHIG